MKNKLLLAAMLLGGAFATQTVSAQEQLTSVYYGKENIGTPKGNPCIGSTRRKCAIINTIVQGKTSVGTMVLYDCYEYVTRADGTPVREGEKEYLVPSGVQLSDHLLSEALEQGAQCEISTDYPVVSGGRWGDND